MWFSGATFSNRIPAATLEVCGGEAKEGAWSADEVCVSRQNRPENARKDQATDKREKTKSRER